MRHQNKWKRFTPIEELMDQPKPRPTLTYLAAVLESVVGLERQKAFSKSLDWTEPAFVLAEQYEKKIAAERQLAADQITPAYVDVWTPDPTPTQDDDQAVVAGVFGLTVEDCIQTRIDNYSDDLRDETMTPGEAAAICEKIKALQAQLDHQAQATESQSDFRLCQKFQTGL